MSPAPSSELVPSRRAIAKGLAWSVPVVAVAAAVPAAAASGLPISVTNHGLVSTSTSGACAGTTGIDGTAGSGVANYGLRWSNVTSVATPISLTFYFDASGLMFTSSIAGWTTLTQQTGSVSISGTTFYSYQATYTGIVAVTGGSAALTYKFDPSNCKTPPLKFDVTSSSVVNGATRATNSGVIVIANQNARAIAKSHSDSVPSAATPADPKAPATSSSTATPDAPAQNTHSSRSY